METGTRRRLAAILSADVAGYSRLMGADEVGTHRSLTAHRETAAALVAAHDGRIFGTAGDSIVAEFPSAVEAVRCAVAFQQKLEAANEGVPPERQMRFRIGINLGDVIVDGADLFGDGVNVAARLQAMASPGGICISGSVHEQVSNKLALPYRSLGQQKVKNIAEPVRAFAIGGGAPPPHIAGRARRAWVGRRTVLAGAATIAAFAGLAVALWQSSPVQPPQRAPETTGAIAPARPLPARPSPAKPSIAVLPFANLSGGEQDFSATA